MTGIKFDMRQTKIKRYACEWLMDKQVIEDFVPKNHMIKKNIFKGPSVP